MTVLSLESWVASLELDSVKSTMYTFYCNALYNLVYLYCYSWVPIKFTNLNFQTTCSNGWRDHKTCYDDIISFGSSQVPHPIFWVGALRTTRCCSDQGRVLAGFLFPVRSMKKKLGYLLKKMFIGSALLVFKNFR